MDPRLRQHIRLQRAEDQAKRLLAQLRRRLEIAAQHVRDEAEDGLEDVGHQQPAVVLGNKIAVQPRLQLLVVVVVQRAGAGQVLRGIVVPQIKADDVRPGQAERPRRLPERVAALLERHAPVIQHVEMLDHHLDEMDICAVKRGLQQTFLAAEIAVDIDLVACGFLCDGLGRCMIQPVARNDKHGRLQQKLPVILS